MADLKLTNPVIKCIQAFNKDSLYTVLPQIVSVLAGTVTLLLIPRILGPEEYSQIVFWTILLSFLMVSDFGLSKVYSRTIPALLQASKYGEVESLKSTTAIISILGSSLFGLVAGYLFYLKFDSYFISLLIFLASIFSVCATLASAFFVSSRHYKNYCYLSIISSLLRLFLVPAVYFYGLNAWFSVSVVIFFAITVYFLLVFNISYKAFNMQWVKKSLVEGVFLLAITLFWSQIFTFPRLSASILYPNDVLARYGVLSAMFGVVISMVIAYFLPVTREVYAKYMASPLATVDYVLDLLNKILPLTVALFIMIFFFSPLVGILFPKYNIKPLFFQVMALSVFFLPVLCTVGSIYVASTKTKQYLFIVCMSFVITMVFCVLGRGLNMEIIPAISLPFCTSLFAILLVFYLPWVVDLGVMQRKLAYKILMKYMVLFLLCSTIVFIVDSCSFLSIVKYNG